MSNIVEQARKMRSEMETVANTFDDETALERVDWFPKWKVGVEYAVDKRVSHAGLLYKCITAHTSQSDWTPDAAVSLWVRIDNPAEEWPEWHQPAGAHDAYALGAKVSHNEKHWISNYDGANIWEPGVYGWDSV